VRRRSFRIELEESFKNLLVGQIRRPVLSGGRVKAGVTVGEPWLALVVNVGQGTLGKLGGAVGVAGDKATVFDGADLEWPAVGNCGGIKIPVPWAAAGAWEFQHFLACPFRRV
jgi:hypothetical protein